MPAMDDDSPAPSSLASSPASSDRDAGQEHTLVVPARVTNVPSQSTLARSPSPTPYSPSASVAMLRTAETLEGLAQQLTALDHSRLLESDPDLTARCCCGAVTDCPTLAARDRVDSKLKLSGEIGQALLHRYEALEQKYQRAEQQFELKRRALSDSLRHVANLERANTTHLSKYAELSRSYESLEKRYTQSLHSHTLTQQSLTHVRGELTKSRAAANAQGIALATGTATGSSLEARLADTEQRFEDARTLYQAESRKLRDELKWRSLAEDRIADLETKLTAAGREVEDIKAARARDAQDLLGNAKERLGALHEELSETFQAEHPSDTPEYLRTLEDLVATNALLKHDTSELARTLSETLTENRALREEVDELKSVPRRAPNSRPLSMELRPLLTRSHMRTHSTGSHPQSGSPRLPTHARVASAAVPRTGGWGHRRDSSLAPSFTSTSTTEGVSVTSPGLGPGPGLGFFGDMSGLMDDNASPEARIAARAQRGSFSGGGIPYVHNGVPKNKRASRTAHRRSLTMRAFGPADDSSVVDTSANTSVSDEQDDNVSASESNSRKRASVLLPSYTSPRSNDTPLSDTPFEFPTSQASYPADSTIGPQKRGVGRRTLLLLSRSTDVQADAKADLFAPAEQGMSFPPQLPDAIPELPESPFKQQPKKEVREVVVSAPGTPVIGADPSETSSMHEMPAPSGGGVPNIGEVVDFLTKVLVRLRGVDIPTLNRRLKKQNLPADVGHVSRTTISTLQSEVSDMRHRFRNLQEQHTVSRRELTLLLKLLKDVFSDLLDLQSIVNDVTIDPKLAKKLRREAFEEDKPAAETSGLWGIAAPITSYLFTTPAKAPEPAPQSPKRSRLAPPMPVRPAPKLPASTSASTASVTVFGGSVARRSTTPKKTVMPQATAAGEEDVFGSPPSPAGHRSASVANAVPSPGQRPVRTRASRSDLMGIFAGAQAAPPVPRVRHASSQYFGGRPVRSVSDRPARLSTIVDAVLDPTDEDRDPIPGGTLQRTLRPRGLSDSSIRSTAIMDSIAPLSPGPPSTAGPVPARAIATGTNSGATSTAASVTGGMLSTLSKRIYSFPFRAVVEPDRSEVEAKPPADRTPSLSPGIEDAAVLSPTQASTMGMSRSRSESPEPDSPDPSEWRDMSATPRTAALTISSAAPTTATLAVSCTTTPVLGHGASPIPGKDGLLDLLSKVEDREREREAQTTATASRNFTPGSLPRAVWR